MEFADLLAFCRRRKIPVDVPFASLTEDQQALIVNGDGDFYGIRGFFEWLETKRYKLHVRVFLARYRGLPDLPRLRRNALQARDAPVADCRKEYRRGQRPDDRRGPRIFSGARDRSEKGHAR